MSYSYDRTAGAPSYKGRNLDHLGLNLWTLEGRGVRIVCEGGPRGWSASIEFDEDRLLKTRQPKIYGRDIGEVIDSVIKLEADRLKGARVQLDEREKTLATLK